MIGSIDVAAVGSCSATDEARQTRRARAVLLGCRERVRGWAAHVAPDQGCPCGVRRFRAIDLLRSTLLSHALRDGFDSFLFIDADIGFDPRDVFRLFARPEPVVAGIYVHNKGQ